MLEIQQIFRSHKLKGYDHFWPPHPKIIESTFGFPKFVPAWKKISLFHLFIFEIKSILEPDDQTGHTHFRPCPHKNFKSLFNLFEFVPACKKLIPSVHSDLFNFRVQITDWPQQFLTMANQTIFNQLLIFVNLYQHAKNYTVSLICSGEMLD